MEITLDWLIHLLIATVAAPLVWSTPAPLAMLMPVRLLMSLIVLGATGTMAVSRRRRLC
jgi:hypothetical protein